MASYPTSLATTATLITPSATAPRNNPSHVAQHGNLNAEVIAIETALGVGITNTYATAVAWMTTLGTLATAAQTTATTALANAAIAQTTANSASVAATAAQTTATAAQTTATTAIANASAAQTTATAAQTTATAARLLAGGGLVWVAGSTSAATTYIAAPFAGAVSGYWCQGGVAPTSPGLVTVTVGSAGAILLTGQPSSAGVAGTTLALSNTSGTTTIAAGASMLITLAASGTAFVQSVTLAISRTA